MSVSALDDEDGADWRAPFQQAEALPDVAALSARRRDSLRQMQAMSVNPSVQHALQDVLVGLLPRVIPDGEFASDVPCGCIDRSELCPCDPYMFTADAETKLREMLVQAKVSRVLGHGSVGCAHALNTATTHLWTTGDRHDVAGDRRLLRRRARRARRVRGRLRRGLALPAAHGLPVDGGGS